MYSVTAVIWMIHVKKLAYVHMWLMIVQPFHRVITNKNINRLLSFMTSNKLFAFTTLYVLSSITVHRSIQRKYPKYKRKIDLSMFNIKYSICFLFFTVLRDIPYSELVHFQTILKHNNTQMNNWIRFQVSKKLIFGLKNAFSNLKTKETSPFLCIQHVAF